MLERVIGNRKFHVSPVFKQENPLAPVVGHSDRHVRKPVLQEERLVSRERPRVQPADKFRGRRFPLVASTDNADADSPSGDFQYQHFDERSLVRPAKGQVADTEKRDWRFAALQDAMVIGKIPGIHEGPGDPSQGGQNHPWRQALLPPGVTQVALDDHGFPDSLNCSPYSLA
jgi:hypothetical protein